MNTTNKDQYIGARFISGVKIYYFLNKLKDLKRGDWVVVENQQGEELAKVVFPEVDFNSIKPEEDLQNVLRKASDEDKKITIDFFKIRKDFIKQATELVNQLDLKIKFVDVTQSVDESRRLLFLFVADGRVDFRDLLMKMSRKFNTSNRFFKICTRDAARMIGGLGVCGQKLCCSRFLNQFESITMDMARQQDLINVGSNKISGLCGKLLCCLDYELDMYKKLSKGFPGVGDEVFLSNAQSGRVIERNVLLQMVTVETEDGLRKNYSGQEVKIKEKKQKNKN